MDCVQSLDFHCIPTEKNHLLAPLDARMHPITQEGFVFHPHSWLAVCLVYVQCLLSPVPLPCNTKEQPWSSPNNLSLDFNLRAQSPRPCSWPSIWFKSKPRCKSFRELHPWFGCSGQRRLQREEEEGVGNAAQEPEEEEE